MRHEKRNYLIFGDPHSGKGVDLMHDMAKEMLTPVPAIPLLDYPHLTRVIGGFRPREFSILAGSTGTGKTTLVANWSKSLLKQGVPHFVASVETGHTDFMRRTMSAMVGEDCNTGEPIPLYKVKKMVEDHKSKYENLHLSLYDNRFSVEELMNDIAWHVEKHQCKVAFIDNLNFFLEVTRAADQIVEMDRVIHELIIFCKQVDVHVVMVMHPKKTDNGRVESEFDIKGSSTAVQEAHNVFLFNRAGADMIDQGLATKSDREIKIAKMRRKGKAHGQRLILKSTDGVSYFEGGACV